MTNRTFTRRAVTKGLALSARCAGDAGAGSGEGAGEIGEDRDDRADVGPVGAAGSAAADGRRSGGRRCQRPRRHQIAWRRQARNHLRRCRRQHRKGQERSAAAGVRPSRSGRRHRLLAQLVHLGGDRGHRTRRAALADPQLFRRDHQSRLQVRFPDLADRRPSGGRDGADRARPGAGRDRQAPDHRRPHHGQHRLAGQLRQAAARGRVREGRAQAGGRPDFHPAAFRRHRR